MHLFVCGTDSQRIEFRAFSKQKAEYIELPPSLSPSGRRPVMKPNPGQETGQLAFIFIELCCRHCLAELLPVSPHVKTVIAGVLLLPRSSAEGTCVLRRLDTHALLVDTYSPLPIHYCEAKRSQNTSIALQDPSIFHYSCRISPDILLSEWIFVLSLLEENIMTTKSQ